ncbi:LptF/LptG family permease [Nonlabens xiamenensis]|uniref:LptF/LptG family permease n=1 Tax=Nonlabens xiamenensis TaxID=2341043 RepID=UPI000F604B29|nr:LptF/LptG family permease [Nonlabens xiamenensis]
MKILDRYILTQFVKTFLSVFTVLMFILILQAIWLYIKELAGKDLDAVTIAKFLYYSTPVAVPIALPLSVLLASILVFGKMAENYEFAAMKSNGISLQRAMRSLTIVILGIGITSFLFANSVIPWGYLKQRNLRGNIAKLKPAMAIGKGTFNQIGDINIKVADKSGERGEFLTDVIIHKKNPKRSGNYTVIKSKRGELKSSLSSNVIQLVLEEGNYYDDIFATDPRRRNSMPFVKSYFDSYTLNVDVSELNDVDLGAEEVTDNHRMLKINELYTRIDTLSRDLNDQFRIYRQNQHNSWDPGRLDSRVAMDSLVENADPLSQLDIQNQRRTLETASNRIRSQLASVKNRVAQVRHEFSTLAKHEIEIHKKYVLGVACIILFFIGAPLGAIIRKGGMGLPLVVATLFFLAYHFIGIFAEKAATEGAFPAWLGAWMSTMIIFPIGIYLTYRATTDQGVFGNNFTLRNFFSNTKNLLKPKGSKS